jgi:predicted TPR repeat methyltransferase
MDQSPDTERVVSFEEAMEIALFLQQTGKLDEAARAYARIREVAADHPDVLLYSGVLAYQQGRGAEAVDLIQRSLLIAPDRADAYNNLGIVLKGLGRLDEAIAAYQRAIAIDPSHANAYSNLGVVLRAQERFEEAERAYQTAIQLDPKHVDALVNLGHLYEGQRRYRDAYLCGCKVTALCPKHPEARKVLALAYRGLGMRAEAAAIYREWAEEEPDNPVPRHMLAATSGEGVPERASDAYIERCFDGFASSFDAQLAKLHYQAPQIVAAVVADSGLGAQKQLDVLDAGCGTGLCGPLLAPWARRLTGIDLSGPMLDKARERRIYDDLVKAELTAYLRDHEAAFDVIASADTLVYFGALEEVCAAAAAALRPGGLFVFTLERATDEDADREHTLKMTGRYVHARSYVERVLAEVGLRSEMVNAQLRMESGLPVEGLAVRATKPVDGPGA